MIQNGWEARVEEGGGEEDEGEEEGEGEVEEDDGYEAGSIHATADCRSSLITMRARSMPLLTAVRH